MSFTQCCGVRVVQASLDPNAARAGRLIPLQHPTVPSAGVLSVWTTQQLAQWTSGDVTAVDADVFRPSTAVQLHELQHTFPIDAFADEYVIPGDYGDRVRQRWVGGE